MGWRGGLATRVQRLLDGSMRSRPVAHRPAVAASLVGAALALAGAGTIAPAVVFADLLLDGPRAALRSRAPGQLPTLPGLRVQAPAAEEVPALPTGPARSTRAGAARVPPAVTTPLDAVPAGDAEVHAAVVLEGRPVGYDMATLPAYPAGRDAAVTASPSPWTQVATAGRAIGQAGERTGATIGDAAARGGSAVGKGARRTGTSVATFFSKKF